MKEFLKKSADGSIEKTKERPPVLARMVKRVLSLPKGILERRKIRRARERIATVPWGQKDFTAVQGQIAASLKDTLPISVIEDLVRESALRRLGSESELMKHAEEFLDFVSPYPRHVKRFLNRLRLFLFVAHEKNMLGGQPPLTAQHIAKWVALCERWPLLAKAISADPRRMTTLEGRTSPRKDEENIVETYLTKLVPEYAGDIWLRPFIWSPTRISEVIERLIHFEPATGAGSAE